MWRWASPKTSSGSWPTPRSTSRVALFSAKMPPAIRKLRQISTRTTEVKVESKNATAENIRSAKFSRRSTQDGRACTRVLEVRVVQRRMIVFVPHQAGHRKRSPKSCEPRLSAAAHIVEIPQPCGADDRRAEEKVAQRIHILVARCRGPGLDVQGYACCSTRHPTNVVLRAPDGRTAGRGGRGRRCFFFVSRGNATCQVRSRRRPGKVIESSTAQRRRVNDTAGGESRRRITDSIGSPGLDCSSSGRGLRAQITTVRWRHRGRTLGCSRGTASVT